MGNFARDVDSLIELDGIPLPVEYVVVAGGGGINSYSGSSYLQTEGGGGAGGYRSSVSGESSGGGASAESPLLLSPDTAYTITVGAGNTATNGGDSTFHTVVSIGGGRGWRNRGAAGGSGAGEGYNGNTSGPGAGTAGQGYAGGNLARQGSYDEVLCGGGGGAGGVGGNGSTSGNGIAGSGGTGVTTNITGSPITLAGGGGGAGQSFSGTPSGGAGGAGGGGAGRRRVASSFGSYNLPGNPGAANTGGGAGGGLQGTSPGTSVAGGSGIIFIRVPNTVTATFSAGVTHTLHTPTGYNVYEITAAGASDTVTFSR